MSHVLATGAFRRLVGYQAGTMQDRQTAALIARIEQGQRDGDVGADVDARAFAEFLATTLAGLRVMVMTHNAPTLYRVIDSALATLH